MKDNMRFSQAKRMWEIFSVLLLLTFAEANSTDPAVVMTLDSSTVEVSHPGLTVPEVQSLGGVEATSSIPDSPRNPTSLLTVKQDGRDIQHSTLTTQEEIQSSPTPATTQQGENITLKTPGREKDSDGSGTNAKASILPKEVGHPAQIQPRKGPLEKETPKSPVVSRTSRQSGYGSNRGQQAKDNRSPSFETTRGK